MPVKKKSVRKKKKVMKKKSVPKKKALKKKTSKKKTAKKKTAKKKTSAKRTVKRPAPRKSSTLKKTPEVKPGPPPSGIPSVEEPLSNEEAIGVVTHYYSHLNVAVIQLNRGDLKTGDTIHVKGHTTDFSQRIDSMEYEHHHIEQAKTGQSFGLKVKDHAREHDIVYRVK